MPPLTRLGSDPEDHTWTNGRIRNSWRKSASFSRRTWLLVAGMVLVVFIYGISLLSGHQSWAHAQFISEEPLEVLELGTVRWYHCNEVHVEGSECGVAVVPLDYTDPSAGTATIALGRYKATRLPRRGMIMVNPGGPGMPAARLATELGANMQAIIGDEFDIVGFDPRGMGRSDPRISCFGAPPAYRLFRTNTVLERGVEVAANVTDRTSQDRLRLDLREWDALTRAQYELCAFRQSDKLRYVGTSYVARDIDYITTLIEGKDALINYHGGSYGTVIGQYIINMFPNRVGRMVLDGVVDAHMWTNMPVYQWYRSMLTSAEDAYKRFLAACSLAGPGSCDLARSQGEDPTVIGKRLEGLFASLYDSPISSINQGRAGVLTSGRARKFLFSTLVRPRRWHAASQVFAAALNGNASSILSNILDRYMSDLESEAITCADSSSSNSPPVSLDTTLAEYTHVLTNVSRWGLAHPTVVGASCERWSIVPPERYLGPWDTKPRNPVLIVSNSADPVTPLSAASIVDERLKSSSALLIQNTSGHTSHSVASLCTARHTRAYFRDGTLPPTGTTCEPDERPFPGTQEPDLTEADRAILKKLIAYDNGLHGAPLSELARHKGPHSEP